MRPFVITGCGNSGTLYVARLLSDLGVRTSFEEFFVAQTHPHDVPRFDRWLQLSETCGESSSLAAPFIGELCATFSCFHQVRNPVQVIRSHMGRETFEQKFRLLPNVRFFFRYVPAANHDDSPLVLSMKYWLHWNRLCRESEFAGEVVRYRVEDMAEKLPEIFKEIGAKLPDPTAALAKYGTNHHTGPRDESITLASLPAGDVKDELVADSLGYGYTLEELENA